MADMGPLISAADEYGDERFTEGKASRQPEVDSLNEQIRDLQALKAQVDAELENTKAALEECKAGEDPEPPPDPEPTGVMPPYIGSSSLEKDWAARKEMLEATGGELEARRLFAGSLTKDMSGLLADTKAEGLVAVISYKPSPSNWAGIASGSQDSALASIASKLNAFDSIAFLTISHEPQKESMADTTGEAGSAADFARMIAHIADFFHARCPKVRVGPIMNGWIWSGQARGHSDAVLDVWLPRSTREKCDFIAGDHYAGKNESEHAVDRCKRMVAWMKRVGYTGSAGIGETNGWVPSDLNDMFGYAKTEPQFRDGFAMLWNSTVPNPDANDWRPVHETGLLDDFQNILANWR